MSTPQIELHREPWFDGFYRFEGTGRAGDIYFGVRHVGARLAVFTLRPEVAGRELAWPAYLHGDEAWWESSCELRSTVTRTTYGADTFGQQTIPDPNLPGCRDTDVALARAIIAAWGA